MAKPVLISGIQPTGKLHIGNYLGALKQFVELQNSGKYECYFFLADLHALTENPNPKELKENVPSLMVDYVSAGINPKQSTLFVQSSVPAHTELMWILNTITPLGELARMTQFKEKASLDEFIDRVISNQVKEMSIKKYPGGESLKGNKFGKIVESKDYLFNPNQIANVGLYDYPVLMASDILLYNPKFVPVGDDQLQHLELTRELARKFNSRFGKTFLEPQPVLTKSPRIMSLDDPTKKMSKSRPAGCLFLDDSPEAIKAKIKTAVTDSGNEMKYSPEEKPGISNLLLIYSALCDREIREVEKEFAGKNYGEFKRAVGERVAEKLAPFQKEKRAWKKKMPTVKTIFATGGKRANAVASKKLKEIKTKIGLL